MGLVIGHVGPEAALGGEIGLIEDGDEIVIDLNANEINCTELRDSTTRANRKKAWEKIVSDNGGAHPSIGEANTRLLNQMRNSAVSANQGAGMHPGRQLWVSEPRQATTSGFQPKNVHRPGAEKAF